MKKETADLYAAHVAEIQSRWENALDAENLQAVLVHSGTPIISFQDDYEYAFRPNPNFRSRKFPAAISTPTMLTWRHSGPACPVSNHGQQTISSR